MLSADQLGLTFSQSLLYEAVTAHFPPEMPNIEREAQQCVI